MNAAYWTVSNRDEYDRVAGRHLEVRVTLWRVWTTTSMPVLYDLTVYAPTN